MKNSLIKSIHERIQRKIRSWTCNFIVFLKWVCISLVVGVVIGGFSILFGKSMDYVTDFRQDNIFIIYFLPLAGILIVAMHRLCHYEENKGTNTIISNLHAKDDIPMKTVPLIFISTVATHLFGGSAGRESAALQLGGSL